MQFEQLNIDSQIFDRPMQITYRTLDNDGKIYCKIDWLTVMFFDCSMNHVLSWLHMDDCVSEFCAAAFQQSRGYDEVFKFIYNGVMLETSSFNFYGEDMSVSIFDTVVPKIRLELSGSALDYLRSIGVDMDSYRFVKPRLPDGGSYHFTRCDWAFDFINYMPEFVDQLMDHINEYKLPSGRVPLASTNSAIGCRMITGTMKLVYLGSAQSDRMLRVYDKRMEQTNLNTGTYVKPNPYGDPDSWFRIEWVTRNKFANDLVQDATQEPKNILRMIFDKYAFANGTENNHNKQRSVVDFWLKLFDWKDIESRIIQNAKYVEYESPDEKLINSFESVMIRTFIFYYTLMGREGVEKACNKYLASLNQTDPVSRRRLLAFYNKLNNLSISGNIPADIHSSSGLWNNCGRLYFHL